MSNKDQSKYITTHYPESSTYVRVDKETGASWTWKERPFKCLRTKRVAFNGVTVDKLTARGNKVRVRHFRHAIYHGGPSKIIGNSFLLMRMVVPSTFRHDVMYQILPKGGYTHITVQTEDGEYYCYSSVCHIDDPFCYSTGIATALERISPAELKKFYGAGLPS